MPWAEASPTRLEEDAWREESPAEPFAGVERESLLELRVARLG